METTKNEITPYAKDFFYKLGNYLDTKIYYYGSVQRNDYFQNSSDIDVDIFTDNEASTISKIQHFLNIKKYKIKKFVYKLHLSNKIVYGRKVSYADIENNFFAEISIYSINEKEAVLNEHKLKTTLPFYIEGLLVILKYFYYKFNLYLQYIFLFEPF
jgi:predicted nucleotidyltransferase